MLRDRLGNEQHAQFRILLHRDERQHDDLDEAIRLAGLQGEHKAPGYIPPPDWYCRAWRDANNFVLDTNLDFSAIQAAHTVAFPESTVFGECDLIGIVVQTQEDLFYQFSYRGDLQTSELQSAALRTRLNSAIEHSLSARHQIEVFQRTVMPNGRSVREAVNSGDVAWKELLKLRNQRAKFEDWRRGQTPDALLLTAYLDELGRKPILERLPQKSLRFAVFTGLGFAADAVFPTGLGTAVGIGLAAFDHFLVGEIKAWKPSHYINKVAHAIGGETGAR
jgi:hypothetical protein